MTPIEVRLACLRLAVDQPGNPNTIEEAEKFFEFAMKNTDAPVKQDAPETDQGNKGPTKGKKGDK